MSQFFHAHHDTFFLAIITTEQERRERAGEHMQ